MKQCMDQNYFPKRFPAQHQDCQPGIESWMEPLPVFDDPCYRGSGKLSGMTALITGGTAGSAGRQRSLLSKRGQMSQSLI